MGMHSLQLLSGGNATSAPMRWVGGRGLFTISGTLVTGGLQFQASDGTWVQVPDLAGNPISITLGASGARVFELPQAVVRANVAAGSNIYASIDRIAT